MADARPIRDHFEPPRSPDEIGRFGKYRVLRELGAGGMGAVFEAEDTLLRRAVALKFMAPAVAAKPENRERFLREAQAAARVKSEYVVAIHEADDRGGLAFIAMERLRGQALDDFLDRNKPPSLAAVLRIGREVAEGLAAAHAVGLVHRDIKPSNVWLEAPDGKAKVIDFGLAFEDRADTRLTVSGQMVGTPEYIAPEQANGSAVDGRADLFSLGVMLYRLTTGVRPFARESVMASLAAVLTVDPPPPAAVNSQVPRPLSDLILGLMAKDPAARPPGAKWVADALGRMAAGLSQLTASNSLVSAASAPGHPVPHSDPGADSHSYPVSVTNPPPADTWRHSDAAPAPNPLSPRLRPASRPKGWLWAAVGLAACLLVALAVTVGASALRGRDPNRPEDTHPVAAASSAPKTTAAPSSPAKPPDGVKTAVGIGPKPKPLEAPFSAAEADAGQQAWATYLGRPVFEVIYLPGGGKLELVLIPPGRFTMGSPEDEAARNPAEKRFDSEQARRVEISKPFYLGKYEVTQEQYKAVTGEDPSRLKGARLPVEMVSHEDAKAFCRKLTFRGGEAELPTEARWEYACRAGTTTPFHFGPSLNGSQANCNGNVPYGTNIKGPAVMHLCAVGRYPANAFGLHDMHGNAGEWCLDSYGPYSAVTDLEQGQLQNQSSKLRVLRGGSWGCFAKDCRAANRGRGAPDFRNPSDGFRVCVRLD